MSNSTEELKLFLTDMETDGEELFDFDRDLNENFIKIDEAAKYESLHGVYFEKMKDITIEIPTDEPALEDVDIEYIEIKEVD